MGTTVFTRILSGPSSAARWYTDATRLAFDDWYAVWKKPFGGQNIPCDPTNTIAPPCFLRWGTAARVICSVPITLVSNTLRHSSKSALLGAVSHLAVELGPYRIRVNTVIPTWMWGPPVEGSVNMTAKAQGVAPEEIIAGITAKMPLGEIPSDGDVADAVVFFASDRARMITGQTLLVNAGEYIR